MASSVFWTVGKSRKPGSVSANARRGRKPARSWSSPSRRQIHLTWLLRVPGSRLQLLQFLLLLDLLQQLRVVPLCRGHIRIRLAERRFQNRQRSPVQRLGLAVSALEGVE